MAFTHTHPVNTFEIKGHISSEMSYYIYMGRFNGSLHYSTLLLYLIGSI